MQKNRVWEHHNSTAFSKMRMTQRQGALPILLARLAYFCMEIGLTKSFGVLVPDLEEQLQTTNAVIGLVTSLSLATMYLGSPIAKFVVHHCSHRRLLTSVSGLVAGLALIGTAFTRNIAGLSFLFFTMGLCCSFINLQAIVLLFDYYQEDYPFASCITVLGITIGAAFLPPVTEKLLEAYGVSGTLLVIGGMTLNMFPIGLALKEKPLKKDPHHQRKDETDAVRQGEAIVQWNDVDQDRREVDEVLCTARKDTAHSTSDGGKLTSIPLPQELQINTPSVDAALKDNNFRDRGATDVNESGRISCMGLLKSFFQPFNLGVILEEPIFFILYLPTIVLLFLVTGGWALFVVVYAVDHGIDLSRAALLPTCGAVGGIVASILMSVAIWHRARWSLQLYVASLVISAACFFLQTISPSYPYLLAMSFLIGFGLFGASVLIEAVMHLTVLPKNFNDASSYFLFAIGVGYILSGYLSGYILDGTGDIEMVFIFFGGVTVAAILLLVIQLIILFRRSSAPAPIKNSFHSMQMEIHDSSTVDGRI